VRPTPENPREHVSQTAPSAPGKGWPSLGGVRLPLRGRGRGSVGCSRGGGDGGHGESSPTWALQQAGGALLPWKGELDTPCSCSWPSRPC